MIHFTRNNLLANTGRHVASETHIRIHISEIPCREDISLYSDYHGELLLVVLKGNGKLVTRDETVSLSDKDQILLVNSEPFFLTSDSIDDMMVVQFCWLPGPYECKICDKPGRV